mgnify:CR=1 FL=1
MKSVFTFIIVLFSITNSFGQVLNASVKDIKTNEPLPYVNVLLSNKKGVITNGEGRFSIAIDNVPVTDSIIISCIGYESWKKRISEFNDSIVYLTPKAIELKGVLVSNKTYTAKEIIAFVKDSMAKNYNTDLTKKRIFYRESDHQTIDKTNYTFMKSTIEELNKDFLDEVIRSIPRKDDSYTEILCDLYGDLTYSNQKIDMIKACNLFDKSTELDLTSLEERFNAIIKENVKPDSYYKIKSGIFGTKVDSDEMGLYEDVEQQKKDSITLKKELETRKKREAARKKYFSSYKKTSIAGHLRNLFFMEDTKFNVIHKSGKYDFTIQDFTYLGDDPVYILTFEPKRGADYKGTLYVNADDFAIIRLDYENVKPLKSIKLLGISFQEHVGNGKMIFAKGENNKYDLKFFEKETGNRVGIKRPLKIIEKNKRVKGRNKQNELFIKIDMGVSTREKFEIVVFDSQSINAANFDSFKENNSMLPKQLKAYDPNFWKGYNIIEPNKAIKEFTAKE